MQYLTRSKAYEKVEPSKNAKKIYIFCEGARREIEYFKYFQGFSSNIDIIPIPCANHESDPTKLKENATKLFFNCKDGNAKYELSKDYGDEIWFVIDTDNWNEKNKIEGLKAFCDECNAKLFKCWFVSQSNPSFEIWLYYHFYSDMPNKDEVNQFESLKKYVGSKIAGGGGFDSRKMPVRIQTAIENAEKNYTNVDNQPVLFASEVFYLGKSILPFVKESLDKLI